MIALDSSPTPGALTRLATAEAQRQECQANGTPLPAGVASAYRHADVKGPILVETSEKCAYCESHITHVYYGDVEHIEPKSSVPAGMFDYDNLTLACAICNGRKSNYYAPAAPILNPYQDEPDDHLVGLGPLVWHRSGSQVGQRTVTLLDLNREQLRERRMETLERVSALADRYTHEPNGPVKSTLLKQLRDEVAPEAEFAMAVRWMLLVTHNLDWRAF